MQRLGWFSALVFVVGCGGGDTPNNPDGPVTDGPAPDTQSPDGPASAFAITSPLYVDGAAIPSAITCDGANTSPQLEWVNAPAGTLSFAIVFTDTTNSLIHSVIYDIPGNLSGLPADVEKVFAPSDVPGARQTRAFSNNFGYAGPCPGQTHTYEFRIYALGVATLPDATMQTSRAQAKTAIEANDLADTALTATYTPQ